MLWYGSVATIPSGWHECDGTMGTPDLRDRFVRGASVARPPGTRDGATSHIHSYTGDGHVHQLVAGADVQIGAGYLGETGSMAGTGTTDVQLHLPSYESLCFIMKL